MADTAFGQKGEDYVTVRSWYPPSIPLAFFDTEVGKLKAMFYRLSVAGMVCKSVLPIDTRVGDLETDARRRSFCCWQGRFEQ